MRYRIHWPFFCRLRFARFWRVSDVEDARRYVLFFGFTVADLDRFWFFRDVAGVRLRSRFVRFDAVRFTFLRIFKTVPGRNTRFITRRFSRRNVAIETPWRFPIPLSVSPRLTRTVTHSAVCARHGDDTVKMHTMKANSAAYRMSY